ncbi:MAG: DUF624 domain-containing protein [Clostridiales bacterium]|nr:DUF624 domain-containing protein [Clostridiales bacterium]
MRFSEFLREKRFGPGRGVTGPPPEKGIKRFFFILWNHFWKLILLNLLFLAFCIPILTIPAAFCGMNRVLIKLVHEGHCDLWQDFIREFKSSFFKSLPFGVLYAFLLLDIQYAVRLSAAGESLNVWIAALAFCLLGATIVFFSYAFVFIPALPLKGWPVAKNAFIFMLTEWKTNIILLVCAAVLTGGLAAIAYYVPVPAMALLLVIYFAFCQLLVCTAIMEPMRRRIIEPYEKTQNETEVSV